jgi:acyl-coenzyme A thioesterase 13
VDFVRRWVEQSPYARALGVRLEEMDGGGARLRLPFAEANTNPGQVLHGGVAASLCAIGGQVVARSRLGEASGPWHSAGLQVSYLAAAKAQEVVAVARLLREGKEVCFVEVEVAADDGKPIAHATAIVRARFGAAAAELPASAGDHGGSDPGAMGPHIGRIPFIAGRGIAVEHMSGGSSRLVMPLLDANADEAGGAHEGALLALLDTTGAMASWAVTGPGPFRASTPAIQAQILDPTPAGDLVAYGRNKARDGSFFWSDVEVARASDARVVARGTVVYRILGNESHAREPDPAQRAAGARRPSGP